MSGTPHGDDTDLRHGPSQGAVTSRRDASAPEPGSHRPSIPDEFSDTTFDDEVDAGELEGSELTELTNRQRTILTMIHEHVAEHGYPPSVREIGDAVGLRSPSSVHAQLETLARKGYLRRDPTKPRALELGRDPETDLEMRPAASRNIPLVGEIAAGGPILAEQHVDSVYTLPKELVGDGRLFMLKVRGESMIDAGILDGDLVVVREQPTVEQSEMCAALIDGEATVKFFRRTRSGEVFLDPANERYEPIALSSDQDVRIMGKVVTVLRTVN